MKPYQHFVQYYETDRMGYTMLCRGEVALTGVSAHGFLNRECKPISIKRQYPEFYQALAAQQSGVNS